MVSPLMISHFPNWRRWHTFRLENSGWYASLAHLRDSGRRVRWIRSSARSGFALAPSSPQANVNCLCVRFLRTSHHLVYHHVG